MADLHIKKYCIDCIHMRDPDSVDPTCDALSTENLVTGDTKRASCFTSRHIAVSGPCGKAGLLFSPRFKS